MDKENLSTVQAMHDQPKSEFKLFSHFLESTWPTDVPDPYQGSKQDFEIVLDMLEAGCPNILNYLSAQLETK